MNAQSELRAPTAERLLDVRTPAEIAFAPDGSRVAFALHATVADIGSFVPSDLYLVDVDGIEPVRLTNGAWSDRTPVWSPDGSRLAFLSDRIAPGHQLPYTMVPGEEPLQVGTFIGSAESLSWSSDGERLLVLVADPGCYGLDWSARAVHGAGPAPDPAILRPGQARRRLFVLDILTGDCIEVGPPDTDVWEFDWDGADTGVALASKKPHGGSGWYRASVVRLDLSARTMRTLYEPSWQTEWLSLSSDGRRAAVTEGYASDHGLLSGSVMVIDLVDGTTTDPWPDLQTVGIAEWIDDDSLWYARGDGTGTACGRMWLDGRREERWRGDAFIGDEVTTPACRTSDGASTVWTTHQAHGQPPELARLDQAGAEWSRFTSFNDAIVDGVVFPDARTIRWSAPDGMEIEGILMTPRSVDGPLPLIACVHGGPTWNWGAFFSDSEPNAVLLASAGYACLLPNPRGSIGRGHAFAQAVIGDSGGVDFQDIMSGIDRCIADGVADPARLGIAGLSYGGFMAGWAVGQTARFGASVAMSVVANNVSFHLTSEVWMYDEMILKGDWNDPASQYLERSPVTHAHRCTTPTLILQGAEDRCTPVGQGEELYAAITAAGAETELVVYPREGHVPLERAHALDAIRRTQAWFDRFLRERDNDVAGGSAATPTSGTTSSPARNPTEIVSLGYDVVAEDYANLEGIVEWPRMRWLRKVLAELRPESRVLDLGCGSGIPATREIARVHDVVGVDVSARRIELARRNVPGAEFIHDDIESLHFPQASFDAVVAFYVLDHLPRESHADVLGRIHGWLKPGGLLLLTVETEDEPGVTSLWLGVDMFFSCFDAGTTRRLIREAGFETLDDAVETQIEGEREVTYLWVLARSTFSGHPSTGSARRVVNDENHLKQRTTRNDRPGS